MLYIVTSITSVIYLDNKVCRVKNKRDMHECSRVGNEIGNDDLQHQRWWRVQVIRDNKNQSNVIPSS